MLRLAKVSIKLADADLEECVRFERAARFHHVTERTRATQRTANQGNQRFVR